MTYVIKNITDASPSPRAVSIGDIPGVGIIVVQPGRQQDLEVMATRNQILDSSHLKLHIAEGRLAVETISLQPDERTLVDASLRDEYGNYFTSTDGYGSRRLLDVWIPKGVPEHFNGTVGTTAITIAPSSPTMSILIYNPTSNASGVTLGVSFDDGTNFFDIERRGSLEIEAEVSSFQIKASAASSSYQIIVTRR